MDTINPKLKYQTNQILWNSWKNRYNCGQVKITRKHELSVFSCIILAIPWLYCMIVSCPLLEVSVVVIMSDFARWWTTPAQRICINYASAMTAFIIPTSSKYRLYSYWIWVYRLKAIKIHVCRRNRLHSVTPYTSFPWNINIHVLF